MKKNLFLAMAAVLLLASCGDESSSSSTTPKPTYGALETPLTVAETAALLEKECADAGSVSQSKVYVQGYVVNQIDNSSTCFSKVYLTDDLTNEDAEQLYIYKINITEDATFAKPQKNDKITAYGWLVNYQGTKQMGTTSDMTAEDYAYVVANEQGNGTVTVQDVEGVTLVVDKTTGKNGDTVTATVSVEQGKVLKTVQFGGVDGTKVDDTHYTGKINGDTKVKAVLEDNSVLDATLSFASGSDTVVDSSNATTSGAEAVVYTKGNVTVTAKKASSTTNLNVWKNTYSSCRFYAASQIIVGYNKAVKKLVFTCDSGYAVTTDTTVEGDATAIVDGAGTVITVKPTTAANSIQINLGKQWRVQKIDLYI